MQELSIQQQEHVVSEAILRAGISKTIEGETLSEAYKFMGLIGVLIQVRGFKEAVRRIPEQDLFYVRES